LGATEESQLSITGLSTDGRTVALRRAVNGNTDVWLMDTARGALRRLTFDTAVDGEALFSPDGKRVVYASDPKGTLWDIFDRPTDGTSSETLLVANPENDSPTDWSPDGRYILYGTQSTKTDYDIWALPLFGDQKPFPLVQTSFFEADARFSPDGRWIAFMSNETGRGEIYVQPFPSSGAKMQISVGGGRKVRWPRGGSELFYMAPDNQLMAVSVGERESTLVAGTPHNLFPLSVGDEYEPSPDGRQFLISRVTSRPAPITIVLNWKPPAQ
jgi:eukaryotic-like serine/threonine-protein kinase